MTIQGFLEKEREDYLQLIYSKKSVISKHSQKISKNLDLLSSKQDNILLIGDFNEEPTETAIHDFCRIYYLANLVKEKICFKGAVMQI